MNPKVKLYAGTLWLAVLIFSGNTTALAQDSPAFPKAAISIHAVTDHILGISAEVRLTGPLGIAGRLEGINRQRAWGFGPKLMLNLNSSFSPTLALFAGQTSCTTVGETACFSEGSAFALAPSAAAEFAHSPRWSSGIEVTYWYPLEDEENGRDYTEPRLTIGASLKLKLR